MQGFRRSICRSLVLVIGGLAGCQTPSTSEIPVHQTNSGPVYFTYGQGRSQPEIKLERQRTESAKSPDSQDSGVLHVQAVATAPQASLPSTPIVRPKYGQQQTLPIDLSTAIRLVDAQSPSVGMARAKVREAEARLAQAEVQWLPNLTVGMAYTRFDGNTQNQRGEIFSLSRASLFASGGPALTLDTAEAIFRPLIERRNAASEQLRSQAVQAGTELETVGAYLDLVQLYALLEINAETLAKAESMLKAAENAKSAKLDRTAGDIQRAKTEVLLRRTERIELEGRIGAASAKLARILLLPSNVKLIPTDTVVAPLTLIDPESSLDALIAQAVSNRPDLAANREAVAAAWARYRKQKISPWLPKLAIANQVGSFGGGLNGNLENFESRNALSAQVFWEFKNLGFGNRYEIDERSAMMDQAQFQATEAQAKVLAEIVEAAQISAARAESLALAEQAVKQASELYDINKEGTFNVIDAKNLFDALRPLQSIQVLNQARQNYLTSVIEYNRAQFRLFTLTGNSSRNATVKP